MPRLSVRLQTSPFSVWCLPANSLQCFWSPTGEALQYNGFKRNSRNSRKGRKRRFRLLWLYSSIPNDGRTQLHVLQVQSTTIPRKNQLSFGRRRQQPNIQNPIEHMRKYTTTLAHCKMRILGTCINPCWWPMGNSESNSLVNPPTMHRRELAWRGLGAEIHAPTRPPYYSATNALPVNPGIAEPVSHTGYSA